MLTRVDVKTARGTRLVLPLEDFSDGYLIEEIEGLDPVKAVLTSSSFAGADGELFHSSRREARDIKMRVAYEPDYATSTVMSLRNRLYSYLMPESEVTLVFTMSTGLSVEIIGLVEEHDAPLFTDDPVANISIHCSKPDFVDPNPVLLSGLSGTSYIDFEYYGTVETGLLLDLTLTRDLTSFALVHIPPTNKRRQLNFAYDMLTGDNLQINTVSGQKSAGLRRNNILRSVLYGVAPGYTKNNSNWLQIVQGPNRIQLAHSGASIPYTIQYFTRYGGL